MARSFDEIYDHWTSVWTEIFRMMKYPDQYDLDWRSPDANSEETSTEPDGGSVRSSQ